MRGWRIGIAALLMMLAGGSSTAHAATGVAFVHGTGAPEDAVDDYWTAPMIDRVASGLSDPSRVLVVQCDLSRYVWDEAAAGCIADDVLAFVDDAGLDDLVVITHSNGANAMRWILSNPTWDERYPAVASVVREVIALSPSSLGTPLADAVMAGNTFETNVGWLLGYDNDGVRMQQPANMAWLNDNWLYGTAGRPELPSPMWTVVGTDVETNFFDHDSWCGGYHLNVGLEITQNWLDGCSDGFLECSSQEGAGDVWMYDVEFTAGGETLSHAQSRRDCFGLGDVLADAI
jgi:pimeloyl-ACP methyl ester carboxylesterase